MSDLWALFFANSVVKQAYEIYGQEDVDAAINQELQFCLDEITMEKIEKLIKHAKETEEIEREQGRPIE